MEIIFRKRQTAVPRCSKQKQLKITAGDFTEYGIRPQVQKHGRAFETKARIAANVRQSV